MAENVQAADAKTGHGALQAPECRLRSDMMNLSEEQKKLVAAWVAEGASLAEVQQRLKE